MFIGGLQFNRTDHAIHCFNYCVCIEKPVILTANDNYLSVYVRVSAASSRTTQLVHNQQSRELYTNFNITFFTSKINYIAFYINIILAAATVFVCFQVVWLAYIQHASHTKLTFLSVRKCLDRQCSSQMEETSAAPNNKQTKNSSFKKKKGWDLIIYDLKHKKLIPVKILFFIICASKFSITFVLLLI